MRLSRVREDYTYSFARRNSGITNVKGSKDTNGVLSLRVQSKGRGLAYTTSTMRNGMLMGQTTRGATRRAKGVLQESGGTPTRLHYDSVLLVANFSFFCCQSRVSLMREVVLCLQEDYAIYGVRGGVVTIEEGEFRVQYKLVVFARNEEGRFPSANSLFLFSGSRFLIIYRKEGTTYRYSYRNNGRHNPKDELPIVKVESAKNSRSTLINSRDVGFSASFGTSNALFDLRMVVVQVSIQARSVGLVPIIPGEFGRRKDASQDISRVSQRSVRLFLGIVCFNRACCAVVQ